MSNPSVDIPNLLYRYANFMDAGDFSSAAELFESGCIEVEGHEVRGRDKLIQFWKGWVFLYDGKPLTRHLIANPIISMFEDQSAASCRSQWTVLQATNDLPLQPIATGRYHDDFECTDGNWHFVKRRYDGIDLMGDMSQHTRKPIKESVE